VKADRRVRRTEKLLHGALISLVLQKKYESITIQEILDRADIGSSTFYAHFKSKGELLSSGIHLDSKAGIHGNWNTHIPIIRLLERQDCGSAAGYIRRTTVIDSDFCGLGWLCK
jgi:Bacterial regulatory proteins, tetR family